LYLIVKRIIDLIISLLGLVLLLPAFLIIVLFIKLDSHGPVFYRASRVGMNGYSFNMYKFRTMVTNADQIGGSSTPDDDPRMTKLGRFLRKYKFDEFPQLINVFKGEMSLVGPRPQVKWAVDLYTQKESEILSVKPGIADYAALKFSNEGEILKGSVDPDRDYMRKIHPEKMRLSLEYIRMRSLKVDINIIIQTMCTIFK